MRYVLFFVNVIIYAYSVFPNFANSREVTLEESVDEFVKAYIDDRSFVGAQVVVIENDKTVVNSPHGFSDLNTKALIKDKTVFALGSNTKMLTSSAIMLLQQRNQIKLDDLAEKYIALNSLKRSGVTIRSLLCHTSGLPDIYNIEDKGNVNQQSIEQFINLLNDVPKTAKPFEEFQYNNTGYLLLGKIIETVSGQSLGDFYRENIFSPLNLESTFYLGDTFLPENMSKSYEEDFSAFDQSHRYFSEYRVAQGAGGAAGSLEEFGKWHKELIEGELLTTSSIEDRTSPCTLINGKEVSYSSGTYGFGLKMSNIKNLTAYFHGGAINGYVSDAFYFPELDLTILFAVNTWKNPKEFRDKLIDLTLKQYLK
jgi:CubicO group peptidase (beta-lactamase class C family)